MRVIVCGSRYWAGSEAIHREMVKLPADTVVIQGGCRGADELAAMVAHLLRLKVETFPAEWDRYGRAAGNVRNQAMLDSGCDRVLAFHANLDESKGTKDMVARARRAGVPVELFGD